jgi:hypothetical protein
VRAADGAARADVVPLRGQPHGPRAVHLGLRPGGLPAQGRQVRFASCSLNLPTIPCLSLRLTVILHLISVRAFRGIRTNEAYAQKLAQKRARQEQRERDRAQAEEERARHDKQRKEMLGGGNPFAVSRFVAVHMRYEERT